MTTSRRSLAHHRRNAIVPETIILELNGRLSKVEGKLDMILGVMAATLAAIGPVVFYVLSK